MSGFDLSGALRRIRRIADLSQRELARSCGISQSAIAQAESGRRDVTVGALAMAAAHAGLRLALLDSEGAEVEAMAPDTVRDLGGRRFPAHLDTRHSYPERWLYEPRRDRPEPWYTFDRDRGGRDYWRGRTGTPDDHLEPRPGDSPQERKAERQRAARQQQREEYRRRLDAGEIEPAEPFDCTCPPECDELDDRTGPPVHAADCPCRCDVA